MRDTWQIGRAVYGTEFGDHVNGALSDFGDIELNSGHQDLGHTPCLTRLSGPVSNVDASQFNF